MQMLKHLVLNRLLKPSLLMLQHLLILSQNKMLQHLMTRIVMPISVFDDPIRKEPPSKIEKNHPSDLIIGNPSDRMTTRQRYVNLVNYMCYISMIEPKNVKEILLDEFWVNVMQEELKQFLKMMFGLW